MLPVSIEGILIGMGTTLLCVCVGGYLGYHFSRKVAEEQMRKIAGAKLRAAFTPEISKYYLLFRDTKWKASGAVAKLLEDALPKHAAAIEEFRPFVPRKNQDAYKKAWENYHTPSKEIEIDMAFWAYEKYPEIFEENIEAILKFTEPF